MAKAAKITIAEVEEIVDVGEIPADQVHLPGIFVDRLIKGDQYEKRIEVFGRLENLKKIRQKCAFYRD